MRPPIRLMTGARHRARLRARYGSASAWPQLARRVSTAATITCHVRRGAAAMLPSAIAIGQAARYYMKRWRRADDSKTYVIARAAPIHAHASMFICHGASRRSGALAFHSLHARPALMAAPPRSRQPLSLPFRFARFSPQILPVVKPITPTATKSWG